VRGRARLADDPDRTAQIAGGVLVALSLVAAAWPGCVARDGQVGAAVVVADAVSGVATR